MTKYAPLLLLIGGALLAVPYLYTLVTILTGGSNIVQVLIGITSILAGVSLFRGQQQAHGA